MKKAMTNEQKRELILAHPSDAYYQLINADNYGFFTDAFYIAEQSIIEITGCYITENSLIVQKHVMLQMWNMKVL